MIDVVQTLKDLSEGVPPPSGGYYLTIHLQVDSGIVLPMNNPTVLSVYSRTTQEFLDLTSGDLGVNQYTKESNRLGIHPNRNGEFIEVEASISERDPPSRSNDYSLPMVKGYSDNIGRCILEGCTLERDPVDRFTLHQHSGLVSWDQRVISVYEMAADLREDLLFVPPLGGGLILFYFTRTQLEGVGLSSSTQPLKLFLPTSSGIDPISQRENLYSLLVDTENLNPDHIDYMEMGIVVLKDYLENPPGVEVIYDDRRRAITLTNWMA